MPIGEITQFQTLRPDLRSGFAEFDIMNKEKGFIGTQVLPIHNVEEHEDSYPYMSLEQLLTPQKTLERAPSTPFPQIDMDLDVRKFATKQRGVQMPLDDEDKHKYRNYFEALQTMTGKCIDTVLRHQEMRIANIMQDVTLFSGAMTNAVGTEWSNIASDPITDIKNAGDAIFLRTGYYPNTLAINKQVFRNLQQNTKIIARIEATGAGEKATASQINAAKLAEVFDLDQVLVAGEIKNNANEGATTRDIGHIWSSEYATLTLVNPDTDSYLESPGVGRTFHVSYAGSQPTGLVESWYEEMLTSQFVRVRHTVDEIIHYKELTQVLSNITA